MNKRKNIDKLFQEKFQDFEINPPEFIWENIEEKLKEKKKRRVIPFWWWSSGIAALFVIGLFIWNSNTNQIINSNNNVVIDENRGNQNIKEKLDDNNNNSENDILKKTEKIKQNKEVIVATENKNNSENKNQETNKTQSEIQQKQHNVLKNNSGTIFKNNEAIASKTKHKKSKFTKTSNDVSEIKNTFENNNNSLAENNSVVNKKEKNSSILIENQNMLKTENNIVSDKIAMKNQDNIATKGEITFPRDSTAIATVEKNELEELLNEKERKIAKEQKLNRWQVTPNLAPIYFGSFENGSPLDNALDENTKSYSNNISYGVAVDYSISKKVKIRTGINAITVDYNTNDIAFFQNNNARMMRNIDPTVQGSLIEIIPIKNVNTTAFNRVQSEQSLGVLNQRMGYIEMPFEVSYKLLDNKFGVEVIGGMSTLFLNKNEVFLEADGMNMKIGEATNLNPFHLSTNFGVGFNYGFLKNFQARIEPTFKYQLNTFTRDSQNFKPYIFGIYSGISYRF